MRKRKLKYGYKIINCPICKTKTFEYCSYSDNYWGGMVTVEQHGNCTRCGYRLEQAYCEPVEGFFDIVKGFKNPYGEYFPKNIKKHKRIRRKLGIKNYDINPEWMKYI